MLNHKRPKPRYRWRHGVDCWVCVYRPNGRWPWAIGADIPDQYDRGDRQ